MPTDPRAAVGLPPRPFFYTLDQVATLLGLEEADLVGRWVFWEGRTGGIHKKDKLKAVNLAPLGERPEWRVAETELVRWLRNRGIRIHERFITA